jgi:hypothetical protein
MKDLATQRNIQVIHYNYLNKIFIFCSDLLTSQQTYNFILSNCIMKSNSARCETFTTVKIQVEVFWVTTLCSVVVGYQRFRGPCCLHLHGILPQRHTVSQTRRSRLKIYFCPPQIRLNRVPALSSSFELSAYIGLSVLESATLPVLFKLIITLSLDLIICTSIY